MSKLKVAKFLNGSFIGLLILVGLALVGIIIWGLIGWAGAHFLSFALVMGFIGGVGLIAAIGTSWEWAVKVIRTAAEEEAAEVYLNKHGHYPKGMRP